MSGLVTGSTHLEVQWGKEINITFIKRAERARWGKICYQTKAGMGQREQWVCNLRSALLGAAFCQERQLSREPELFALWCISLFIYRSSVKMNFKADNEVWNPTLGCEELLRRRPFPSRDDTGSACAHTNTPLKEHDSLPSTRRNKTSKSYRSSQYLWYSKPRRISGINLLTEGNLPGSLIFLSVKTLQCCWLLPHIVRVSRERILHVLCTSAQPYGPHRHCYNYIVHIVSVLSADWSPLHPYLENVFYGGASL